MIKVYPPRPAPVIHSGALGHVYLNPGEQVEWIWTHTPTGSYVSGYDISRSPMPCTKFDSGECEDTFLDGQTSPGK